MLDVAMTEPEELGVFENEMRDIFSILFNKKGVSSEDVSVIVEFPKYVVTRRGDVYYLRGKAQKLAQVKPTNRQHPTVNLVGLDDLRRGKLLSRIVASAFISLPQTPSHRVFHRDGDTKNNNSINLYWSSLSPAKEIQMIRSGTKTLSHAKLDEEEVLAIYRSLLKNKTLREIGNDYEVTPQTIQMIRDGLTWKHIITKKMLFYLRGLVNRDELSIKQYIISRTKDSEIIQIPSKAYSGLSEKESLSRRIMITESGYVFDIASVSALDIEKYSLDTSYVSVLWLHAKKTVTVSKKPFSIAYLIAYAFYGSPADNQYLNYIDGDSGNIHSENLEWVSHRVGRLSGRGRVLTVPQVREIKKLLDEGCSVREISEQFKVSRSAVYKIKNQESWSWV